MDLHEASTRFTLDTSGCVRLLAKDAPWKGLPKPDIYWIDLDPFTQGYGKRMARDLFERLPGLAYGRSAAEAVAFSNWAPETLAAILKDCEALRLVFTVVDDWTKDDVARKAGAAVWAARQRGQYVSFPPLTPYLRDDRRVYLRETVSATAPFASNSTGTR